MSKSKYKYMFIASLGSLLIIYIFISYYIKKNFDFRLAETFLFLTVDKFKAIALNFSKEQIQAYIVLATSIDIIWPIAYCLFFYTVNDKLLENTKRKHLVNFYIFFIFLFDMAENILTARYLITKTHKLAQFSVLATNLKWISIIFLLIIFAINFAKFLKKKSFKDLLT